jgi:hypothetical protein
VAGSGAAREVTGGLLPATFHDQLYNTHVDHGSSLPGVQLTMGECRWRASSPPRPLLGERVYPVMVGLPGKEDANSAPPTCALFIQRLFLVGLALLLRRAGTAWMRRPRNWFAVASGNSMVMTIFCWHLTACYLVQAVILATGTGSRGIGVGRPTCAQRLPGWVLTLSAWLLCCTLVCVGLVALCRRFEHSRVTGRGRRRVRRSGS